MCTSSRGVRLSTFGVFFSVCFLGLTASTMAWVEPPKDYPDVKLAEEFVPGAAVAFDPSRPNRLVAGLTFGDACWVRRSIDGGRTWGETQPLPRPPGTKCSLPITLSYASDGSQLHAAYSYFDYNGPWGIALTTSDDHGETWSDPTVKSLPEVTNGCRSLDSAVAPDDLRSVYLTAICNSLGVDHLYFARMDGDDLSWDLFSTIASLDGATLSQANLAAGRDGAVLVTYGQQRALDETAVVVVASSRNRGTSFVFGNATAPFRSKSSPTVAPDVAIGSSGKAHLVYMRSVGSSYAVLYKNSVPPYKTWSTRGRRLDDDDGTQLVTNSPRITVSTCENTSILHVSWIESTFPPLPQQTHKLLYTRKLEQASSWSYPLTVSETTEITTPNLVDLAAGRDKAFPIFGSFSFASFKTQIVGSRVWSGVTCRW